MMMAEAIGETQDVYRPNVSSYDAPNMERERAPAAPLALDKLSIFSGTFSLGHIPNRMSPFIEGEPQADELDPTRQGRAVRVPARPLPAGRDDERGLRPGRAVDAAPALRTKVGDAPSPTPAVNPVLLPAATPPLLQGPLGRRSGRDRPPFVRLRRRSVRVRARDAPAPHGAPARAPSARGPRLGRARGLGCAGARVGAWCERVPRAST